MCTFSGVFFLTAFTFPFVDDILRMKFNLSVKITTKSYKFASISWNLNFVSSGSVC